MEEWGHWNSLVIKLNEENGNEMKTMEKKWRQWKWNEDNGNETKKRKSRTCIPNSAASYLLSPSNFSGVTYSLNDSKTGKWIKNYENFEIKLHEEAKP